MTFITLNHLHFLFFFLCPLNMNLMKRKYHKTSSSLSHPSTPMPCEILLRSTNCQIWRCGRANWEEPSRQRRSWGFLMNSGRYSTRLMLSVSCHLTSHILQFLESLEIHGALVRIDRNYETLFFWDGLAGKESKEKNEVWRKGSKRYSSRIRPMSY